MFERRSKFIALRSLSVEQAPTYCHIVQKIQKMRYCSLSGSRRIYVGTGKRSLFPSDDALDIRLPIFLTKSNPSELYTPLVSIARGTNSCVCDRAAFFVSWASQRVLLQLLVDRKLTQCVKALLHPMWGVAIWPMASTLRRLDVFHLIEGGRLVP